MVRQPSGAVSAKRKTTVSDEPARREVQALMRTFSRVKETESRRRYSLAHCEVRAFCSFIETRQFEHRSQVIRRHVVLWIHQLIWSFTSTSKVTRYQKARCLCSDSCSYSTCRRSFFHRRIVGSDDASPCGRMFQVLLHTPPQLQMPCLCSASPKRRVRNQTRKVIWSVSEIPSKGREIWR